MKNLLFRRVWGPPNLARSMEINDSPRVWDGMVYRTDVSDSLFHLGAAAFQGHPWSGRVWLAQPCFGVGVGHAGGWVGHEDFFWETRCLNPPVVCLSLVWGLCCKGMLRIMAAAWVLGGGSLGRDFLGTILSTHHAVRGTPRHPTQVVYGSVFDAGSESGLRLNCSH